MTTLSFREFDQLYQEVAADVYSYWRPQMQEEIAKHNAGWAVGRSDFGSYLRLSVRRYFVAYNSLASSLEGDRVCDVGGFWGAFPLLLRRLGYRVTMTESFRYYSEAFIPLFDHLRRSGVRVLDLDPFADDYEGADSFDAVTCMAVIEHYPHSVKIFMGLLRRLVSNRGLIYIEVPNLAYWPKRLALLQGSTPLPPLEHVFNSAIPFTGHHREYTIHDLRQLAFLADFKIIKEHTYNYSSELTFWRQLLCTPFAAIAYRYWPFTREVLSVLCRPLTPVQDSAAQNRQVSSEAEGSRLL